MTKKKQSILLEAATAYYKQLNETNRILNGLLENELFDTVRDTFQDEAEVKLHEALWSKGPDLPSVSVGKGGPGMYGKASEPFGKLVRAMDSFGQADVNSTYEKLASLVSAADDVLPFLEAEEPVVRREAKMLLAKLFMVINNMFKVTAEKAKELREKLPADFNVEEALNILRGSARQARESEEEEKWFDQGDAASTQKKPGLFGRLFNKLTNKRDE
jgi:hypothetical protein